MKKFISLIIVFISILCFAQDKFDIIKKRRIARIEAMRTDKYKEQKIKWYETIKIKVNSKSYSFTSNKIETDKYQQDCFDFQVVKIYFALFGNYKYFENFNRSYIK